MILFQIDNMHLCLIILTLATIAALPDISPHEGALFQEHGFLIGGLSWAHITAPINISRMEEDLQKYQHMVDYYDILSQPMPGNKGQVNDDEQKRLMVMKRLCERRIRTMTNIIKDLRADLGAEVSTRSATMGHQAPDNPPANRQKRQLAIGVAAIGGLLVGAITGSLFSQFKTTALIDILERRVNTVVHQVDDNTIGIYQSREDIKRINSTLATFEKMIGKLLIADSAYDHYFASLYTTLLVEEQVERFTLAETAIDQLLLGKLHKGLISPEGLNQAIDDLHHQARDQGLLVGIRRPLELYQLHTSFAFNQTSNILFAVIHVPMYRESHVLSMQRYIPIPFYVPTLDRFIEIRAEHEFLARSQDGTLIKTLSDTDLSSCLSIGHAYFCEDHALSKATAPNCLHQLSKGIKQENLDLCLVHILPQVASIHQTHRDEYILASSNPTTITETCPRSSSAAPIKVNPGTYKMKVDPNCTTSAEQWVIYPTLRIENLNVKTAIVQYDFDIPRLHDSLLDWRYLRAVHEMIGKIGTPVPLAQMTRLLQFRQAISREMDEYRMTHLLATGGTAFSTALLFVTVGLGTYYLCRCYRRPQRPRRLPRDHYETIPMVSAAASPAPIIIQTPAQTTPATATTAVINPPPRGATNSAPIFTFPLPLPKGNGSLSS